MPVLQNNKMKLLTLLKIFNEKTDSEHGLTINEIIAELDKYDIRAERKSLYDDIDALNNAGYEIVLVHEGKSATYRLKTRLFTLPELKILVDTIASSNYLTVKKSDDLIKKIEELGSKNQAASLKRNVFISGRAKSDNDAMFDNIDKLSEAINLKKKISFEYNEWNHSMKLVKRANGDKTDISPCFIELHDGNYYMVAFEGDEIRHFRVDKMKNIVVSKEKVIEEVYKAKYTNPAQYSSKLVGMYSGKEESIRLKVAESKIGIIFDKFGTSSARVIPIPDENGLYTVRLDVSVSKILYGWLFSVSDIVKLEGPEWVVDEYRHMLEDVFNSFEK